MNIELKGKYWFYLEPYVYTEIKGDRFILYNTLDHENIIYKDKSLSKLIKSVIDLNNCGVTILEPNNFEKESLQLFLNEVREKFLGDIIPIESSCIKPIQPLPIVHLINDYKKDKIENRKLEGRDILNYLSDISIFLYTSCQCNCEYCNSYYKQLPFCSKLANKNKSTSLDTELLKKIVDFIVETGYNGNINIFGGDLNQLNKNIDLVSKILSPIQENCKLFCYKQNIYNFTFSNNVFSKEKIIVLLDYPIDLNLYNYLKVNSFKNIILVIKDESEFNHFNTFFTEDNEFQITLKPFYNNKNINFFTKNVFLNKEEILSGVKNMQYIHQNIMLNKNFFGKITIMPNGEVHSNVNSCSIGNIKNSSMVDIIYNELSSEKSFWMKTRSEGVCKKCLFQYLCPPISNYEIALKKKNLCTIANII